MNRHRFPYGPGLFCPVSGCLNVNWRIGTDSSTCLANRYRIPDKVVYWAVMDAFIEATHNEPNSYTHFQNIKILVFVNEILNFEAARFLATFLLE